MAVSIPCAVRLQYASMGQMTVKLQGELEEEKTARLVNHIPDLSSPLTFPDEDSHKRQSWRELKWMSKNS